MNLIGITVKLFSQVKSITTCDTNTPPYIIEVQERINSCTWTHDTPYPWFRYEKSGNKSELNSMKTNIVKNIKNPQSILG